MTKEGPTRDQVVKLWIWTIALTCWRIGFQELAKHDLAWSFGEDACIYSAGFLLGWWVFKVWR